jgi:hypothetical protein
VGGRRRRGGDDHAGAGASAGEAGQPHCHRRTHDLAAQWRPHAAGVHRDDRRLVLAQCLERHALVAHVAQAGVESIDQLGPIDVAVDDGTRVGNPAACPIAELHSRAVGDADDVSQLQRRLIDENSHAPHCRSHPTAPARARRNLVDISLRTACMGLSYCAASADTRPRPLP